MIVAFTGSHSTGKSTIVNDLKGCDWLKAKYVDSVTRSTISTAERRIDRVTNLDQAQQAIADSICKRMKEIVEESKDNPDTVYVLDRCVFDFLAYSKSFRDNDLITEETFYNIQEQCRNLWKNIDIFFYLAIEFDIVDDGERSVDNLLRHKVDEYILDQLLWNRVRAAKITGTKAERLATVASTITDLRNEKGV